MPLTHSFECATHGELDVGVAVVTLARYGTGANDDPCENVLHGRLLEQASFVRPFVRAPSKLAFYQPTSLPCLMLIFEQLKPLCTQNTRSK